MSEKRETDHKCEGTKTGGYMSVCRICAWRVNWELIKKIVGVK